MNNPAFIVDGYTEKLIVNHYCPTAKVARTDLNGKNVTLQAIANKIIAYIKIFNNKYYPIIILVDRENRIENCNELSKKLLSLIKEKDPIDNDIRVAFADKMIENWILADWQVLETVKSKPENTDGLNGSSEIKKIRNSYSKTTDGVDLLKKCCIKNIYYNSPSFQKFINLIQDINCHKFNLKNINK